MATGKRRWKFLIYPESLPNNWLTILEEVGVPTLVSPLHDQDRNEDGTLKKPHYHVMISLDGAKPYDEVLSWFEPLGVKILKEVKSPRRDERYWCHLDSPSKAKYDIAGLIAMNGYECKYLGEREQIPFISQIHKLIEDEGIIYFADLGNEINKRYPDLQLTLIRYTAYFNNYCHSRERLLKQNKISGLMSSYQNSRYMIRDDIND